ncbi:MAG: hypothetical protein OXK81_08955 [Chloroflexota bacterium]|nr:hypothetical protein [Chloroflexota bacterium]
MKRLAAFLGFFLFLLFSNSVAAAECEFVLGFKTIRDLIGHETVGECLENEHHGANGDALQKTTGGQLVWRKADNFTAFTDGYRSWISGPNGLVQRLNSERFPWEADYAPGGGIATPTPTPTPVAMATSVPVDSPTPTATPIVEPIPTLVELAMASPWYRDGLGGSEHQTLRALLKIDKSNPQFFEKMSTWAWLFDNDMTGDEERVIWYIADLGARMPQFTSNIVALPWLADGIEAWERRAVSFLKDAAENSLDFAIELVTAPWVVDGLTLVESEYGIVQLATLAGNSFIEIGRPELARRVMGLIPYPSKDVDFFLVYALRDLALYSPEGLERLFRQPWFRDGLDEEERIYLIAAGGTRLGADQLFKPYSIASSTIALPQAGVVNLWFVHRQSARIGRVAIASLERAVQDNEQFWEIPFPVNDVILTTLHGPYSRNIHLRHVIQVTPRSVEPVVIHHEIAHYYFRTGPTWLDEGGATYVEEFFVVSRGNVRRQAVPTICRQNGVNNLQDLVELDSGPVWNRCRYPMGLNFLVTLRAAMGNEAWLSALRAIYSEFGYERIFSISVSDIDDEVVYRAFMEHAPKNLRNEVRDVFRRLHGGPFVD